MKKNAFTLAESMVMLGIVAVLAGLAITAIANARPDEEIVMAKKAYSITQKTVNSLINDEKNYPKAKLLMSSLGLKNKFILERTGIYAMMSDRELQDHIIIDGGGGGGGGGYQIVCAEAFIWNGTKCVEDPNYVPLCEVGYVWNPKSKQCEPSLMLDRNCIRTEAGTGKCLECESGYILNTSANNCVAPTPPVILPPPTPPTPPVTPPVTPPPVPPVVTEPPTVSTDFGTEQNSFDFELNNSKGLADMTIPAGVSYTAATKFASLFASTLNSTNVSTNGNTTTFSTPDGLYWKIVDGFNTAPYRTTITVSTNGLSSTSCTYNASTCPTPDQYSFFVEKSGKVVPADQMGCTILRYPKVNKFKTFSKAPYNNPSINTCFQ